MGGSLHMSSGDGPCSHQRGYEAQAAWSMLTKVWHTRYSYHQHTGSSRTRSLVQVAKLPRRRCSAAAGQSPDPQAADAGAGGGAHRVEAAVVEPVQRQLVYLRKGVLPLVLEGHREPARGGRRLRSAILSITAERCRPCAAFHSGRPSQHLNIQSGHPSQVLMPGQQLPSRVMGSGPGPLLRAC